MKTIVVIICVCFVGLTVWNGVLQYELGKLTYLEHCEKESKLVVYGISVGKEMAIDSLITNNIIKP